MSYGKLKKYQSGAKIEKISNEFSHQGNADRLLKLPSVEEIKNSVDLVLTALENKDKIHFDGLKSVVNIN